jgi:hypothetical protein
MMIDLDVIIIYTNLVSIFFHLKSEIKRDDLSDKVLGKLIFIQFHLKFVLIDFLWIRVFFCVNRHQLQ